jgi:hypothetical protein
LQKYLLQRKLKASKAPSIPSQYKGLGIITSLKTQEKLNVEENKRGCKTSKKKLEGASALLVDSGQAISLLDRYFSCKPKLLNESSIMEYKRVECTQVTSHAK